jgi:Putative F0F1-ATPase subunit Ca2+/Mg2+ transporter
VKKPLLAAARFIGIGWYVGLCIVGGFFGGRWVGQKVGAETFCSLAGLGLGVVIAIYGMWEAYSLLAKKSGSANKEYREK